MRKIFAYLGMAAGVILLLPSAAVFAFSSFGAGTAGNPYRISTCAQLHEIDDAPSAYYILITNIDCSGSTFAHLASSTSFSGTLDGRDHSITHLNIDSKGLFSQTDGATIKNLSLASGSIISPDVSTGSIVASSSNTTLTNVHSSLDISSTSYGYLGGLVGFENSTTVISQSSFDGSISYDSSDAYIGGLVGYMGYIGDDTDTISDSYGAPTITLTNASFDGYVGGVVGGHDAGTIQRTYSAAVMHINGADMYTGGIDGGGFGGTVQNSFSAASFTDTTSSSGAMFGVGNGTSTNNYFDQTVAGLSACTANGSAACTGVNVASASPNYFKNNATNAPLNTWDFTSVWKATTSGYPALRAAAGFATPAWIPNSGDANGDGVADAFQANVANIIDAGNVPGTITIPSASNCTLDNAQSVASSGLKSDTGYLSQVNMASFDLYCLTPGASVPVTIIYDKLYTGSLILRYYNPATSAYTTVPGAVFGTKTVGGVSKTIVTYTITDGGPFDRDGAVNGIIQDPVGLAILAPAIPAAPSTGFGTPPADIVPPILFFAGMTLVGLGITRYSRRSFTSLQ